MSIPIIPSKLNKPRLTDATIKRDRLINKLGSPEGITLISSSAGTGKSTLAAQWLDATKVPYLWYSLDAWDHEVNQFFSYMAKGIESIDTRVSKALSNLLEGYQAIGHEAFVRAVITELHRIEEPFALVFDDYHLIESDFIDQVMITLMDHMPERMGLIILTREDPLFPLGKLRVRPDFMEIRSGDLRFLEQETTVFFRDGLNIRLDDSMVKQLSDKTEGWIAGLQLAGITIQGSEDKQRFIHDFTGINQFIMDYLLEEVLMQQEHKLRHFMLTTALLGDFCGPLCDTLMELKNGESQPMILSMAKANLFVISLDQERQWFRYHHLFRDLLLQRLTNLHVGTDQLKLLHEKAAKWYTENGQIKKGIQHYLSAGNTSMAAHHIECLWNQMDIELNAGGWLAMAKCLPPDEIQRRPVMLAGYGWTLVDTGAHEGAEIYFERARLGYEAINRGDIGDYIVSDQEQFNLLPATVASAYAYLAAATGDYQALLDHTERAIQLTPEDSYHKVAMVSMLLAIYQWIMGDLTSAEASVRKALATIKLQVNPVTSNSFHMVLGEILNQQGRFDMSVKEFNETLERASGEQGAPILIASLELGLAKASYLQGDKKTFKIHMDRAKVHGFNYALMDWKYKYYLLLARHYMDEGLLDLAEECLLESRDQFFLNPLPDEVTIDSAFDRLSELRKGEGEVDATNELTPEKVNQGLAESLTVREMEVLELIGQGLSNKDICNRLFLALSTVKSYNQNIFGKLGVKRRTEAVAKSRELGLIK